MKDQGEGLKWLDLEVTFCFSSTDSSTATN